MSSAFKCDICGEFFEYEPLTVLTKRGDWCVNDNGDVTIYKTDAHASSYAMEFCKTCSEDLAAIIFDKRMKKAGV